MNERGGAALQCAIEPLEARWLLSFTVTSLADDGSTGTLRWAIGQANSAGGDQTISFDPSLTSTGPVTISLSGSPLDLNDTTGILTIDGPGANLLTIDAQGNSGVFTVDQQSTAAISGLTITGGNDNDGGGIADWGNLTVSNSTISGNEAFRGGGISTGTYAGYGQSSLAPMMTGTGQVASHAFPRTSARADTITGGASFETTLDPAEPDLTLVDSTVSGNDAVWGGGITAYYNSANIVDSTISGNSAIESGGGIYSFGGTVTVSNSTIANNTAGSQFGGILAFWFSTLTVTDSTISGNSATRYGGIYSDQYSPATIDGTIIAGNSPDDLGDGGDLAGKYDLIGDGTGGLSINPSAHNILGTTSSPIDPRLSPLGDYGGPTQTMALLPGSPAIRAGSDFGLATDQRGLRRPGTSLTYDIGAYQTQGKFIYVSTEGNDTNDGLSPDSPVKTLAQGELKLRNNYPDELLLKSDDTFYDNFGIWQNKSGLSATEPMVIGSYGTGDRPVLAIGANIGINAINSISNLDIVGISFYANTRDPSNASFSRADALHGATAIRWVSTGSNLLIENCSFNFAGVTIEAVNNTSFDNVTFEDNQVLNTYNMICQVLHYSSTDGTLQQDETLTQAGSGAAGTVYFVDTVKQLAYLVNVTGTFVGADTDTDAGVCTEETSGAAFTPTHVDQESPHSTGLYCDGIHLLDIENSVFDHDGWNATTPGAAATVFNQNVYIQVNCTGLIFNNNISARAAATGLQARPGGQVTNNLFIDDPIGLTLGLVNGGDAAVAGGVTGVVSGNIFVGTATINGAPRGTSIDLGNIASATVDNNIAIADGSDHMTTFIALDRCMPGNNVPDDSVGIQSLTIEDNIEYGWGSGLSIDSPMTMGGSGPISINGLVVENNQFFNPIYDPSKGAYGLYIYQSCPYLGSAETWQDNLYVGSASSTPFEIVTTKMSFASWQSTVESTASDSGSPGVNISKTLEAYDSSIGGLGTIDDFLGHVDVLSPDNWDTRYLPSGYIAYLMGS